MAFLEARERPSHCNQSHNPAAHPRYLDHAHFSNKEIHVSHDGCVHFPSRRDFDRHWFGFTEPHREHRRLAGAIGGR